MLLLYSFGSHNLYRRLVLGHYIFFTAGCALCAPIAFGLYEASNFASAFYVTASFAAAAGLSFGAYFACRLARSSVGVLGSLKATEEEPQAEPPRPRTCKHPRSARSGARVVPSALELQTGGAPQ